MALSDRVNFGYQDGDIAERLHDGHAEGTNGLGTLLCQILGSHNEQRCLDITEVFLHDVNDLQAVGRQTVRSASDALCLGLW